MFLTNNSKTIESLITEGRVWKYIPRIYKIKTQSEWFKKIKKQNSFFHKHNYSLKNNRNILTLQISRLINNGPIFIEYVTEKYMMEKTDTFVVFN